MRRLWQWIATAVVVVIVAFGVMQTAAQVDESVGPFLPYGNKPTQLVVVMFMSADGTSTWLETLEVTTMPSRDTDLGQCGAISRLYGDYFDGRQDTASFDEEFTRLLYEAQVENVRASVHYYGVQEGDQLPAFRFRADVYNSTRLEPVDAELSICAVLFDTRTLEPAVTYQHILLRYVRDAMDHDVACGGVTFAATSYYNPDEELGSSVGIAVYHHYGSCQSVAFPFNGDPIIPRYIWDWDDLPDDWTETQICYYAGQCLTGIRTLEVGEGCDSLFYNVDEPWQDDPLADRFTLNATTLPLVNYDLQNVGNSIVEIQDRFTDRPPVSWRVRFTPDDTTDYDRIEQGHPFYTGTPGRDPRRILFESGQDASTRSGESTAFTDVITPPGYGLIEARACAEHQDNLGRLWYRDITSRAIDERVCNDISVRIVRLDDPVNVRVDVANATTYLRPSETYDGDEDNDGLEAPFRVPIEISAPYEPAACPEPMVERTVCTYVRTTETSTHVDILTSAPVIDVGFEFLDNFTESVHALVCESPEFIEPSTRRRGVGDGGRIPTRKAAREARFTELVYRIFRADAPGVAGLHIGASVDAFYLETEDGTRYVGLVGSTSTGNGTRRDAARRRTHVRVEPHYARVRLTGSSHPYLRFQGVAYGDTSARAAAALRQGMEHGLFRARADALRPGEPLLYSQSGGFRLEPLDRTFACCAHNAFDHSELDVVESGDDNSAPLPFMACYAQCVSTSGVDARREPPPATVHPCDSRVGVEAADQSARQASTPGSAEDNSRRGRRVAHSPRALARNPQCIDVCDGTPELRSCLSAEARWRAAPNGTRSRGSGGDGSRRVLRLYRARRAAAVDDDDRVLCPHECLDARDRRLVAVRRVCRDTTLGVTVAHEPGGPADGVGADYGAAALVCADEYVPVEREATATTVQRDGYHVATGNEVRACPGGCFALGAADADTEVVYVIVSPSPRGDAWTVCPPLCTNGSCACASAPALTRAWADDSSDDARVWSWHVARDGACHRWDDDTVCVQPYRPATSLLWLHLLHPDTWADEDGAGARLVVTGDRVVLGTGPRSARRVPRLADLVSTRGTVHNRDTLVTRTCDAIKPLMPEANITRGGADPTYNVRETHVLDPGDPEGSTVVCRRVKATVSIRDFPNIAPVCPSVAAERVDDPEGALGGLYDADTDADAYLVFAGSLDETVAVSAVQSFAAQYNLNTTACILGLGVYDANGLHDINTQATTPESGAGVRWVPLQPDHQGSTVHYGGCLDLLTAGATRRGRWNVTVTDLWGLSCSFTVQLVLVDLDAVAQNLTGNTSLASTSFFRTQAAATYQYFCVPSDIVDVYRLVVSPARSTSYRVQCVRVYQDTAAQVLVPYFYAQRELEPESETARARAGVILINVTRSFPCEDTTSAIPAMPRVPHDCLSESDSVSFEFVDTLSYQYAAHIAGAAHHRLFGNTSGEQYLLGEGLAEAYNVTLDRALGVTWFVRHEVCDESTLGQGIHELCCDAGTKGVTILPELNDPPRVYVEHSALLVGSDGYPFMAHVRLRRYDPDGDAMSAVECYVARLDTEASLGVDWDAVTSEQVPARQTLYRGTPLANNNTLLSIALTGVEESTGLDGSLVQCIVYDCYGANGTGDVAMRRFSRGPSFVWLEEAVDATISWVVSITAVFLLVVALCSLGRCSME